jgi:hypothetical protein
LQAQICESRGEALVDLKVVLALTTVVASAAAIGCSDQQDPRRTNFEIRGSDGVARYDPGTGRLRRIDADINKNGRMDTFGYWDANRLIRIEIDNDEDGTVDRWEHYGDLNRLARIGSSSQNDGTEDTWAYPDGDGFLSRVESDADRDGRIDKRELYLPKPDAADGRVLTIVELEFDAAGRPQRRLHYKPDGSFDKSEIVR